VFQEGAQCTLVQWARHGLVHHLSANVEQVVIVHATWTSAFAISAGQTPIQVHLCFFCGLGAFKDFFDQVDSTSGSIELVAQELVGWTRGSAKAAMHALFENGLGLKCFGGMLKGWGQYRLHESRSFAD
jgi:hypothetical protein